MHVERGQFGYFSKPAGDAPVKARHNQHVRLDLAHQPRGFLGPKLADLEPRDVMLLRERRDIHEIATREVERQTAWYNVLT
jgi:hypothetical protein